MTVYEIPNIGNCTVVPVLKDGAVIAYRITANEGWYIHLYNGVEDTANLWKRAVVLPVNYDFSIVEIRAESDLPEGAEIANNGGDIQIMGNEVETPTEEEYAEAGKLLLGVSE